MKISTLASNITATLKNIYRPGYIALNIAIAIALYYLYIFLIEFQNEGVLIAAVPPYLLYLLAATSSVLLTISVYSISNTIRNRASVSGATMGTLTALAGGVISGCGCQAPILFGLTAFGISSSEVFALNNLISAYQSPFFAAIIAVNLAVAVYYLNRLANPSCKRRLKSS